MTCSEIKRLFSRRRNHEGTIDVEFLPVGTDADFSGVVTHVSYMETGCIIKHEGFYIVYSRCPHNSKDIAKTLVTPEEWIGGRAGGCSSI